MPAISTATALDADPLPATSRVEHDTLIRKVAWRLMPLIMVCYLFAFFDRINISFAKFQLQGALDLSDTAYGLGASLFVIGYVIFEVPSNLLLYRVGARRWIARIMISWGWRRRRWCSSPPSGSSTRCASSWARWRPASRRACCTT